jgi:hypothetical protein
MKEKQQLVPYQESTKVTPKKKDFWRENDGNFYQEVKPRKIALKAIEPLK